MGCAAETQAEGRNQSFHKDKETPDTRTGGASIRKAGLVEIDTIPSRKSLGSQPEATVRLVAGLHATAASGAMDLKLANHLRRNSWNGI